MVPSPLGVGEKVRMRGRSCELRNFTQGPSPQPSPLSTGEREPEAFAPPSHSNHPAAIAHDDRAERRMMYNSSPSSMSARFGGRYTV